MPGKLDREHETGLSTFKVLLGTALFLLPTRHMGTLSLPLQTKLFRRQYKKSRPFESTGAVSNRPCFISKLPEEILLEIFALCIPRIHSFTPMGFPKFYLQPDSHTLDANSPPWTFTIVCRRWYTLTTNCSALWSTIIFPPHPSPSQQKMALIQLSRSEQYPLLIHAGALNTNVGEDILGALFKQRHRWKFAHLPHYYSSPLESYSPLPLLEAISYHPDALSENLPPLRHRHFPRLKSIFCHQTPPDFASWSPDLALASRLTHLTFLVYSYQTIFPLINTCAPHLESLELRAYSFQTSDPMVYFPRLRRLRWHGPAKSTVLKSFDCPQLEEFEACNYFLLYQDLLSPLLFASLTSLSVLWSPDKNDLFLLLAHTKELRFLQVYVAYGAMSLRFSYGIERLCALLSNPTRFPHLVSVSIDGLKPHPRTVQQVLGFIWLVRHRGATLQRAWLSLTGFDWPQPPACRDRFTIENDLIREELKNAMAQLRIEYPHLTLRISCQYGTTTTDRAKRYETKTEMW